MSDMTGLRGIRQFYSQEQIVLPQNIQPRERFAWLADTRVT